MFEHEDDAAGVAQSDFAMNGLLMFVLLLILVLPFINDPKQKEAENIDPPHQGQLRVEVYWPDEMNVDVDTWVGGPVGVPVGYSNLGGPLWNLLRDDLGHNTDASEHNMEVAYTRGLWPGEYIVNVHLYNLKTGKLPVPVKVVVAFKESRDKPSQELFYSNVELKIAGQELTVFRFTVTPEFTVDINSLHSLQKKIRPASRGGTQ